MKRLLILLFIVLNLMKIQAQEHVISLKGHRILYYGIKNPIDAFIENSPCNQIELQTDNGKIYKDKHCKFYYEASILGRTIVTIYKIKRHKRIKIGEENYDVRELPKPIAFVGVSNNKDTVNKNTFRAQQGLLNSLVAFDENYYPSTGVNLSVQDYTITIWRKDSIIYTENTKGNTFSDKTATAFGQLQTNDKVIFTNIKIQIIKDFLDPVLYIIKE